MLKKSIFIITVLFSANTFAIPDMICQTTEAVIFNDKGVKIASKESKTMPGAYAFLDNTFYRERNFFGKKSWKKVGELIQTNGTGKQASDDFFHIQQFSFAFNFRSNTGYAVAINNDGILSRQLTCTRAKLNLE
ncbi:MULTISPECIES: hypothetical protein [Aliivibrio]|uniref:hypothetical protein n=1 Tax=Aliivibrio TaxID=511678 RepID=UPI00036A4FB1|nr:MULTISPECIES: hypothetical protein [Aliivibrio]MBD1571622.1 hypothetical protein [Aliivibrio sp. S10_S31]OCH02028.1 hypothetical protein A6E10_18260 [Aliivibrio fischeri]OCH58459.1 hypothetical protein A6D98_02925 [Aliivibrio fischeri]OEE28158.1 hypothetical protein A1Q3_13790 [Aliivibrio fischeri ZF-211]